MNKIIYKKIVNLLKIGSAEFIKKTNKKVHQLKEFNKKFIYPYLEPYVKKSYDLTKEKSKKFYLFLKHKIIPDLQNKTLKVVNFITVEQGEENWSNLTSTKKWNKVIIWSLVSFSGFGIIWSTVSKVDEIVQSTGKLEPTGTIIDVKVPIGGVIKKIHVKEGAFVEENQLLLELDTTAAKSKLEALEAVRSQVSADVLLSKIQLGNKININDLTENQKIKLKSLQSEYKSRIDASKNALEQVKFQKESLENKIISQEEVLYIRENILKKLKSLSEIGGLSQVKYLKEKQEVIQQRGQLSSLKAELSKIEASFAEAKNRLENTIASSNVDYSTKIEENVKQLAQLENQINEAKLTLTYQEIRSPLEGLIFDLQPAAPGFVVDGDKPILKVVPTDDLVARIFISNRDIAFLKNEQLVKIRLDAYPYNEFGELEGLIKSIGSDVLEPDETYPYFRFPVTVKLKQPYLLHKGKKLPLISGMSVSVNVILRQRPVISLFTEKILPFWSGLEQI